MNKPVVLYPNPLLRMKCARVPEVTEDVKDLIVDLIDTMHSANAAGISAPQLAHIMQVLVVSEKVAQTKNPLVLINPQLSDPGIAKETMDEGCLSFPNVIIPVSRPTTIRCSGITTTGELFSLDFEGFVARVIQHEVDHLEGRLLIDYASRQMRRQIDRKLAPAWGNGDSMATYGVNTIKPGVDKSGDIPYTTIESKTEPEDPKP
jgi:peptide deformylase